MGQEVIQGIFLGLSAVIAVVLVGVFITLGDIMILVGAGIAAAAVAVQWFIYRSREGELAD
ncbi:MAG: hypothetical protein ACQEVA_03675 [Myxococcota bacterium]